MNDELDPAKNPMIPVYAEPGDLDKVGLYDDLGLAPFEISESPERLTEKLAAACPGADVIEIDASLSLQRTAAGTYMTVSGYPLAGLSVSDLARISGFLAERGR
jgi:hypothetical protein